MKIGIAQTRPAIGDIRVNIHNHKKLIALAVSCGTDMIFFPELSITGYEPQLANKLATGFDDSRFDEFQQISDEKNIKIGVGMPVRVDAGILISMIIFQPLQPRQSYYKQHLHSDEYPYFISGDRQVFLTQDTTRIALAICYELSVPEHAENAHKNGSGIYLASVAKTAAGAEKASENLSDIARKYAMTVLMSNCTGICDGVECGGKSAVWNNNGELAGQLDDKNEGVLIFDTDTGETIKKIL